MYTGLYTAVAGSLTQEKHLDVLTHNLANTHTIGFKAEKALFQGDLTRAIIGEVQLTEHAPTVVTNIDPTHNRHIPQHPHMTTYTDFSQGALRETGNPLDIALEGTGFFVVNGPNDETLYTRQGTFAINAEGVLVTQNGFPIAGESGPIRISGSQVNIDKTGAVSINGRLINRLKLVDFQQPLQLEKMGDALFRSMTQNPETMVPINVSVHQGMVEASNNSTLQLLGNVIQTSRAYEIYQRMIKIFDATAQHAVNDIARS